MRQVGYSIQARLRRRRKVTRFSRVSLHSATVNETTDHRRGCSAVEERVHGQGEGMAPGVVNGQEQRDLLPRAFPDDHSRRGNRNPSTNRGAAFFEIRTENGPPFDPGWLCCVDYSFGTALKIPRWTKAQGRRDYRICRPSSLAGFCLAMRSISAPVNPCAVKSVRNR